MTLILPIPVPAVLSFWQHLARNENIRQETTVRDARSKNDIDFPRSDSGVGNRHRNAEIRRVPKADYLRSINTLGSISSYAFATWNLCKNASSAGASARYMGAVKTLLSAKERTMPVYSMSYTTQSGFAVAFGQFGRTVSNVHLAIREWNNRRVTRKLLGRLSDRELADIGLLRSEIDTLS
ncbi:DUF1127 domain-containing protein [Pseudooceanicola sp.]|uniref:DUF1127 domain-containing protein n=1 Tax=Pseudooceanicola sp. TaxID=1914328 RepID=UPI0035C6AB27